MEEERRLCFVAITRARDELVLTQASGSDFEGTPRVVSRFLLDIDPSLLEFRPRPAEGLFEKARARLSAAAGPVPAGSSSAFAPGDRVGHAVFGPGEILAIDAEKGAYVIRFDALPTPRSISFRIRLEKRP